MKPASVALFAFSFSVCIGALWEVFEFLIDRFAGMNMQKTMFGDPSGLTDTMCDLMVDSVGALVVSLTGWLYMRRRKTSVIDSWIRKFVVQNPRLFRG